MTGVELQTHLTEKHFHVIDQAIYDVLTRKNAELARLRERVKALERFAAEWKRQHKQMQGDGVTGEEYLGLYILWKLAMEKDLTPNEAKKLSALDLGVAEESRPNTIRLDSDFKA